MAGKPKAGFYVVLGLVVVGLAGIAVWRIMDKGTDDNPIAKIDKKKLDELRGKTDGKLVEKADPNAKTTVSEYKFVPAAKLPPVRGVSAYKKMKNNTVQFALNVWAGWAPIIHANGGFEAGKEWTTPSGKKFKVNLKIMDNPVAMRNAYASGDVHIGWATLDMLPLFVDSFSKDSRIMPRVFQQIDWSNGGDGIVGRGIKSINELRGKTVALAQNSPSEFFLLNALINANIQPSEVNFKYTGDAFQAAAAFNGDKSIAACVSWAPDIYRLSKVKGNNMLVSTATANKLIADVWFARADFAKDHKDILEGIVRGIFDAMEDLKLQANKKKVAKLMSKGFSIPENECFDMLPDAHWTNYAENREFFLNKNNPANFEHTWETAYYMYRTMGKVSKVVPFNKVMDFSIIKKLGKVPKYANQKDTYTVKFTPKSATQIKAESGEILTKTVVIHFYPNSWDLNHKVRRQIGDKTVEELYDPNVDSILKEIAKLASQYGAGRIVIYGHTDASMKDKGKEIEAAVKELSLRRANSVKEGLINKYKTLKPGQFAVEGKGWDDLKDANVHAKNRRVEVKVYPAEAQ